ncbi:protein ACCELERATED CELL DEATH 6-like isoform X1 [Chenopodium quinoa]|nr:protein ACCELERATED CELL DEATH 6-like isoform X1 [Chenopodium quinoa]
MDAQLQPRQIHPTNDHYHPQSHPSRSNSTPEIGSSSRSSSNSPSGITRTLSSDSQPETPINRINALHYSMLINNDIVGLHKEIGHDCNYSSLVLEDNNDTILHIAASLGLTNINTIIQRSPQLLDLQNTKGDLPIHVAARSCQIEAAKSLLFQVNQADLIKWLKRPNEDGNTALHIALENQQKELGRYLFAKCPNTFYQLNFHGFSPLYLAIKAEFWDLVKFMLSEDFVTSESEEKLSARSAKSVVHAIILAKKKDIFEMMFQNYNEMVLYKTDELGKTPLSYAAYTGFLDGVKCIINDKNSQNQAYNIDEKGYYPIHWACSGGNVEIVKLFISCLHDNTRFMLTKNGRNILHEAAANGKAKVVKFILGQPELGMMINMKDGEGNTPLHLASKWRHPKVVYQFTWDDRVNLSAQNKEGCTALDIAEDIGLIGDHIPSFEERLTWLSLRNAGVPRAPQLHNVNINIVGQDMTRNNSFGTQTAYMLLDPKGNPIRNHPLRKRKHKYKERINTLLLVATLVATVTFASGFTVPGGFNNNNPKVGMATLAHKCAFQVFVITNTIAMYTSILTMVTLIWAQLDELRLVLLSLDFAVPLLGTSLAMMSVAFMAGLYVVLYNVVFWLGLVVLVMGGMFLGALLVFFIPLYSPRSCIRNKILRNVFHVPFALMLLACEKDKSGKHY